MFTVSSQSQADHLGNGPTGFVRVSSNAAIIPERGRARTPWKNPGLRRRKQARGVVPQDEGAASEMTAATPRMKPALRHLRNRAVIWGHGSVISDTAPQDEGGAPQDQEALRQMRAVLRHLRNGVVI